VPGDIDRPEALVQPANDCLQDGKDLGPYAVVGLKEARVDLQRAGRLVGASSLHCAAACRTPACPGSKAPAVVQVLQFPWMGSWQGGEGALRKDLASCPGRRNWPKKTALACNHTFGSIAKAERQPKGSEMGGRRAEGGFMLPLLFKSCHP
jgi:hypothetical protein